MADERERVVYGSTDPVDALLGHDPAESLERFRALQKAHVDVVCLMTQQRAGGCLDPVLHEPLGTRHPRREDGLSGLGPCELGCNLLTHAVEPLVASEPAGTERGETGLAAHPVPPITEQGRAGQRVRTFTRATHDREPFQTQSISNGPHVSCLVSDRSASVARGPSVPGSIGRDVADAGPRVQ